MPLPVMMVGVVRVIIVMGDDDDNDGHDDDSHDGHDGNDDDDGDDDNQTMTMDISPTDSLPNANQRVDKHAQRSTTNTLTSARPTCHNA